LGFGSASPLKACFACENFSAFISVWDAARIISLVVFNRWRSCRELRELAWQQWIDRVSPIARQYGVESPVIRLSDQWRNYFERGLSPERAVSQYKSDCMAAQFDDEVTPTAQIF
jgi:hypothetical protein